MTTTRRTLTVSAALCAVLGLTACGSVEQSATSSQSAGSKAAASSSSDSSTAPAVGSTVPLAELAKRSTAALQKAGTVKAVMNTGSVGKMTMQMRYRPSLAYQMVGEANGNPIEARFVDKAMYLKLGAQASQMTGGKPWLKVDGTGKDPISKGFAASLGNLNNAADPTALYAGAEGVNAKVVSSTASSTTYQATLTSAQIGELTKKLMAKKGSTASPTSMPSTGPMTITQTYDKQDRVTQAKIASSATGEMTITYSGWGEPVSVSAPPAAQVGSFTMPGSVAPLTPTS